MGDAAWPTIRVGTLPQKIIPRKDLESFQLFNLKTSSKMQIESFSFRQEQHDKRGNFPEREEKKSHRVKSPARGKTPHGNRGVAGYTFGIFWRRLLWMQVSYWRFALEILSRELIARAGPLNA